MALDDAGNMWLGVPMGFMTGEGNIARVSPQGEVAQYPISGTPTAIAAGADGRIWFLREDSNYHTETVAMTKEGAMEVVAPGALGLVRGADDAMWFTVRGEDALAVVRLDSPGASTVYPVPQTNVDTRFGDMAVGPDGQIWVTTTHPDVVTSIDVNGAMSQYPLPRSLPWGAQSPYPITAGPDGEMWIADEYFLISMTTGVDAQDYAPELANATTEPDRQCTPSSTPPATLSA